MRNLHKPSCWSRGPLRGDCYIRAAPSYRLGPLLPPFQQNTPLTHRTTEHVRKRPPTPPCSLLLCLWVREDKQKVILEKSFSFMFAP